MEVYKLDKAIDNEKLDLELAIGRLKKPKQQLSQSLKRRKALAVQMNDNLYIEERIEDIYLERNSDEADEAIKDILEKNSNLQEEVKKLEIEQEIQSFRLCEAIEEKDKAKEEIEENNNEIQQLSLQQEKIIDQLTDANEELMNLRPENGRLSNDLNYEKKTYERMMKSQEKMNQLNEKVSTNTKTKPEQATQKKVNLLSKELKRIKYLLAIIMVRYVIHQKNVGVMVKRNSLESVTIAIRMVIE